MNKMNVYLGRSGEYTFLPYHLPAGVAGRCEVTRETYKKGRVVSVVSWRNAVFMGLRPVKVQLDRDVVVHSLIERSKNGDPKRLWMTSKPQEIEQATRQLAKAEGRVLVGGLGLGLAVAILSRNPKVQSITVIEKSSDVIALVWQYLVGCKAHLVEDDLYAYLKVCQKKRFAFDFAFYDTWTQTGQHTHYKYVLPLRKLSIGVVQQPKLECWNEDEMLGQTRLSLDSRVGIEGGIFPASERIRWDLPNMSEGEFLELRDAQPDCWPFYNWMRQHKPSLKDAHDEVDYYMAACKDAERWESKWRNYEQL